MNQPYDVILLAAGSASRFDHQSGINKVLMPLGGRPVFDYSLRLFLKDPECQSVWIVIRENEREYFEEKCQMIYQDVPNKITWVTGGKERQDSVSAALKQLSSNRSSAMLVHDAARPFITHELIARLLEGLNDHSAVIPVQKAKDSMKMIKGSFVDHSLTRAAVRHIQTPQAFETECLIKAVHEAEEAGFYGNEEGELIERSGCQVKVVEGLEQNIKITTEMDYRFARFIVECDQVDGIK